MNGAPKGEIFSVTVKETADLKASLDVGQDIEVGIEHFSWWSGVISILLVKKE